MTGTDHQDGTPVLQADGVTRVFHTGAGDLVAVDHVDLTVGRGELVVLIGPSGAGKSTLLNLLAGLDRPTEGRVLLEGRDHAALSDRELAEVRRDRIGYVFQAFGLLPMLSARENVEIPLRLTRTAVAERDRRVVGILTELGLAGHLDQRPGELSGGQQQRVALARALVGEPQLILADEPTAQLDSATAGRILALIHELVRRRGVAAVVTTHDPALIDLADRVIELRGGRAHDHLRPVPPAPEFSPRTDEIPVVGASPAADGPGEADQDRLAQRRGRHSAD